MRRKVFPLSVPIGCLLLHACGATPQTEPAAVRTATSKPTTSDVHDTRERPEERLPPSRTRSTQDNFVRHHLDIESIALPTVTRGTGIADGSGALALLSRGADGSLQILDLQRTRQTDQALTPPMTTRLPKPEVEEEEEEVEEEEEEQEEQEEIEEEEVPSDDLQDPQPHVSSTQTELELSLRIDKPSGDLELFHEGDSLISRGPRLDLDAVRRLARSPGRGEPPEVTINAKADIPFGVVLGLIAEIRATGAAVAVGGQVMKVDFADIAKVRDLTEELEWEVTDYEHFALCSGEVLLCFSHDEPWGRVLSIVHELVAAGVWQVSYLGMSPSGERTKIPVPIRADPFTIEMIKKERLNARKR